MNPGGLLIGLIDWMDTVEEIESSFDADEIVEDVSRLLDEHAPGWAELAVKRRRYRKLIAERDAAIALVAERDRAIREEQQRAADHAAALQAAERRLRIVMDFHGVDPFEAAEMLAIGWAPESGWPS